MTDVLLVAGDMEEPAHSLILSLHSAYFKTLFQSTGFVESGQRKVKVPLPVHLLSPFVTFLYTGKLELTACNAVEVLEAVELLQLEGEQELVRREVSLLLQLELDQCHSLEAIFPLWDTAVTFSLDSLLDRLLEVVAARLQRWTLSERDMQWINRLGWEEMHQVQKKTNLASFVFYMLRCKKEEGTSLTSLFLSVLQILARDDLCVESEGVLLDLVLRWTEDKVRGNISACGGLSVGKVDIQY